MGITKADLDNLIHLDKEIDEIDEQIHKLTNKIYSKGNYVADTVTDYSEDARGKVIVIRGYNQKRYRKQLQGITDSMSKAKELYLDQLNKLTKDLSEIDDAEIRRIIRLRFVERLEWPDVAIKIGPYATEDSVRVKLDRYIKP